MTGISSEPQLQSAATGRAIRFGFAAVVLGMSYPNIRLALGLYAFGAVYRDMFGGKPLPAITAMVLHAQPFLIGISILLPLLAFALVFVGRLTQSLYLSGVLLLAVFIQLFFTWQGVSAPLFRIVQSISGGGAQ